MLYMVVEDYRGGDPAPEDRLITSAEARAAIS